MISANAIESIRQLFEQSLRTNCISVANDSCLITTPAGMPTAIAPIDDNEQRQLVVLNISSYAFRIVVLFEFSEDAATSAYLAKKSHQQENALSGQALFDTYTEFVNLICGKVNRDLGKIVFHSGLSTPFMLESTCASYISALNPERTHLIDALINDNVRFKLTICLCAPKDSSIDFKLDQFAKEETTAGEMELF